MKSTFRTILFWMHLVSGLVAGIIIGIMSLTGAALAFEPQLTQWADRKASHVQPPSPGAARLPVEELLARVRAAKPGTQPQGVTMYADPESAVLVSTGRGSGVYVDPYTGDVREQGGKGLRAFLHQMEEWHRWLATSEDHRALGRGLTGVCNAAFLFLAVSGLYLWLPRKWTWKTVRPVLWFKGGLKGKARDFNWHNTAGFWALPVLVVLTVSGVVMSYKAVSDLIFTLTGNEPPANSGPFAQAPVKVPEPPPGATPLAVDALFAEAQKQVPAWESISLRMGGGPRAGGPREGAPREAQARGGRGSREPRPSPSRRRTDGPSSLPHSSPSIPSRRRCCAGGLRGLQQWPADPDLAAIPPHGTGARVGGPARRGSGLPGGSLPDVDRLHPLLAALLPPQVRRGAHGAGTGTASGHLLKQPGSASGRLFKQNLGQPPAVS